MILLCKRCLYEWDYKGRKKVAKYRVYVSCPRCHTLVRLK